ncbi:MAG: carboxypeptidase regulatory-like domain-containing protein [Planctomycetes bacterium]|nr:carboxypeptidase regulatory-like domain-containing protein [Planctomycetota bacterium]
MKPTGMVFLGLWFLAGCEGGEEGGGNPPPGAGTTTAAARTGEGAAAESKESAAAAGPQKAWDPALGTATVRGAVKFSGAAPPRRPIDMGSEAKCKEFHQEPPLSETIIVNSNGTLKNVFVWVRKGLEGWKFPVPTTPVFLNQKNCTYMPHVQGVQVKQPLIIRNSDPFLHNVHSLPVRNRPINFGQAKQGMESTQQFTRAEVMVKFKCDVHGWMGAHIGAVDHPYFAITGDDGAFELKNLPPGVYTIEAWHETYKTQTVDVKVGANETKEIGFTFKG